MPETVGAAASTGELAATFGVGVSAITRRADGGRATGVGVPRACSAGCAGASSGTAASASVSLACSVGSMGHGVGVGSSATTAVGDPSGWATTVAPGGGGSSSITGGGVKVGGAGGLAGVQALASSRRNTAQPRIVSLGASDGSWARAGWQYTRGGAPPADAIVGRASAAKRLCGRCRWDCWGRGREVAAARGLLRAQGARDVQARGSQRGV